ncbi:MAG: hypothetical protein ABT20_18660 [Rubrivivax sp. SCN 70-15]|nr:MAG: hypothetical protein ABT20_18660 [Rubrivivax sp. SCN 70-15]
MLPPLPQPTQAVRTTLHLSPAVSVAALLAAQRRGLRLREWLDQVVVDAVSGDAGDDGSAQRVLSDATASLFARLVSVAPERLEGRWRLLYERVRLDDSLWSYPRQTLDEVELDGGEEPVLDEAQLRRRWPELLAAAFLM